MKTWLQAKRELIQQWPVEHNTVEFTQNLDKFGLNILYYPNKWPKDMVDYITEAIRWEYENSTKLFDQSWRQISAFEIAEVVLWLFYWALDKVTKSGNEPFVWYVKEADAQLKGYLTKKYDVKDKKKTYETTNKDLIDFLNVVKTQNTMPSSWDDVLNRIENKIDRLLLASVVPQSNQNESVVKDDKVDKPLLTKTDEITYVNEKKVKRLWKNPLINTRIPR